MTWGMQTQNESFHHSKIIFTLTVNGDWARRGYKGFKGKRFLRSDCINHFAHKHLSIQIKVFEEKIRIIWFCWMDSNFIYSFCNHLFGRGRNKSSCFKKMKPQDTRRLCESKCLGFKNKTFFVDKVRIKCNFCFNCVPVLIKIKETIKVDLLWIRNFVTRFYLLWGLWISKMGTQFKKETCFTQPNKVEM